MSILTLARLSSVQERDIDLLIVEELSSNDEFADWLVARTWGPDKLGAAFGTWHSVNRGTHGESDIVFVFSASDGARFAVLIENKIDAIAQPEQAERYRIRGDHGKTVGDWIDYRTCIIAPERYFSSTRHEGEYDHTISYEEIRAFLACRRARDRRFTHKAGLLTEAIEQNRRGYSRDVSLPVTQFFAEYADFANRIAADLGVLRSEDRAAGNSWIYFRPAGYPENVELVHQASSGKAKLFLKGQADRLASISEQFQPHLASGMRLQLAGKSISITLDVPILNPVVDSFHSKRAEVQSALMAIQRLDSTFRASQADGQSAGSLVDTPS